MKDFSNMNTCERLKYLREERDNHSSAHDLYFKLENRVDDENAKDKNLSYPRQAIYRVEKGKAELPMDLAIKYSNYFGVSLDFLYCNSNDISIGYNEVKNRLGLSDFSLNKLEHMKKTEKEKQALSVLDDLLTKNDDDFIEFLLAIKELKNIKHKNIVSGHKGNTFIDDKTIRNPIILENGDLEYIYLFKVSKLAEKIASSYKAGDK